MTGQSAVADWDPEAHPRDTRGKFSQKLSQDEKDLIGGLISGVEPRKFANDREALTYLEENKPRIPRAQIDAVNRYTGDMFFDLNQRLRGGDSSDPEVARIDAAMRPLPDDLVLTRHVGPEAFGLRPSEMSEVERLAGHKITDEAYSSSAIGTPYGGGLGGVTMHILAPKGTPSVIASPISNNPYEREVLLARGMQFAVSRVVRNNRYGYDMFVVAIPSGGQ